jgi:hypothetical protein
VTDSENDRRLAILIHTALVASVGVYVVLLLFVQSGMLGPHRPIPPPRLFPILAAIGLAQFGAASWVGRRLLRSRRSGAAHRVRLYFLLRAAAAETIGLFGLLAGFVGAPATQTIALFAISAAAMLFSAPFRPAWRDAIHLAESVDT